MAGLRGPDGTLTAVVFADGSERPLGGLLAAVTLHQRSGLATALGAVAAAPGHVAADALVIDALYRTSAGGVSAAGDVASAMPSVANAVAAGSSAAAALVHGMLAEDHGLDPH